MPSILVTGSEGLVGRHVSRKLERLGWTVVGLDIRGEFDATAGDIINCESIRPKVSHVAGILHLAAVSRVVTAERDPAACWKTNVGGTHNVIAAALNTKPTPWLVFASSREVYGRQENLPVSEDAQLMPINMYARSKVECERMVQAFGGNNRALIVRLSNVYGCPRDYPTRVVPAFCRAAASGEPMVIEGPGCVFDFTHVDDVAEGICKLVEWRHETWAQTAVIHLTTGIGTSLAGLAKLANDAGGGQSQYVVRAARAYQPSQFVGEKSYAEKLIGWSPRISMAEGVNALVHDFAGMNL
jgi:nucleoside-diphosphate-sugar epimerase